MKSLYFFNNESEIIDLANQVSKGDLLSNLSLLKEKITTCKLYNNCKKYKRTLIELEDKIKENIIHDVKEANYEKNTKEGVGEELIIKYLQNYKGFLK